LSRGDLSRVGWRDEALSKISFLFLSIPTLAALAASLVYPVIMYPATPKWVYSSSPEGGFKRGEASLTHNSPSLPKGGGQRGRVVKYQGSEVTKISGGG